MSPRRPRFRATLVVEATIPARFGDDHDAFEEYVQHVFDRHARSLDAVVGLDYGTDGPDSETVARWNRRATSVLAGTVRAFLEAEAACVRDGSNATPAQIDQLLRAMVAARKSMRDALVAAGGL